MTDKGTTANGTIATGTDKNNRIFISHATADGAFVRQLRDALEGRGLPVWVDSQKLRGGDKLAAEIAAAIEAARAVIVVLGPETVNSPWVRQEIRQALTVEQQRKASGDDEYRVIPVLLPGIEPAALGLWFGDEPQAEPLAVLVELETGAMDEALPAILAALGVRCRRTLSRPRMPRRSRWRSWCWSSAIPGSTSRSSSGWRRPRRRWSTVRRTRAFARWRASATSSRRRWAPSS